VSGHPGHPLPHGAAHEAYSKIDLHIVVSAAAAIKADAALFQQLQRMMR